MAAPPFSARSTQTLLESLDLKRGSLLEPHDRLRLDRRGSRGGPRAGPRLRGVQQPGCQIVEFDVQPVAAREQHGPGARLAPGGAAPRAGADRGPARHNRVPVRSLPAPTRPAAAAVSPGTIVASA